MDFFLLTFFGQLEFLVSFFLMAVCLLFFYPMESLVYGQGSSGAGWRALRSSSRSGSSLGLPSLAMALGFVDQGRVEGWGCPPHPSDLPCLPPFAPRLR